MKRLVLAALLALVPACSCGELDGPGNVHDLRILAMRAEPPEQRIGSFVPVTVTALVANPPGGFLVGAKWTTCLEQDSQTSRCLESSPGYAVLDGGTAGWSTGTDGAEPQVTYEPDPALIARLQQTDPYRGLGGVKQIIQVELRAGDDTVVGFKRVVFTLPVGPPGPLNVNPVVGPVEFNDAGWAPDASVQFAVRGASAPGQMMAAGPKNQLAILEDESLFEDYTVRTFSGETRVLKEAWRYNFYATNGAFSPNTAGGANLLQTDAGVETQWARVAIEDGGSGPTTVWIVVRDGRGGENWTIRHAEAP